MYEVITEAQSASNAIRSHRIPVLETGNISFPNGRYILGFTPGDDQVSFLLNHRIEGASLITRLLDDGYACYVCAVSSPISSYRSTHVSKTATQPIAWDANDLGEPPLFTPMIVSVKSCTIKLSKKDDGVHEIWDKREVTFEKGSRLALGHVIQLRSSILQLMSMQENKDLDNGQFYVDAESEQGFRFRVNLSPDLHRFLQIQRGNGIREHVMTHIVTSCLTLLQRDFNSDNDDEGGWRSYQNLRAFADYLRGRGLPHWSEAEFRPESVSTILYPHVLPDESDGDES